MNNLMKIIGFFGLFCLLMWVVQVSLAVDEVNEERDEKAKTRYTIDGRVANQALNAKGWHMVVGIAELNSGVDTITLNTETKEGKQDISFSSDSTYYGVAWGTNPADTGVYAIFPINGRMFEVKAVRASVHSVVANYKVRFTVQGE